MISELWKNDTYTNQNIPFCFNTVIYEYDMKEAGFSLTREFKLIDSNKIAKLEKYTKDKRKIELGLIQRDDKEYRDNLKEAFKVARKLFFESNELENDDIISIKKDAIFTKKYCKNNTFGDFIEFRIKNEYTSYIKLNKRFEFYYNGNVDVKGMNDKNCEYHKDYMLNFIGKYFNKMETSGNIDVIEFTKRFIDKYKRRELELGYYRTFDINSCYIMNGIEDTVFMDCNEDDKYDLDISYNFHNILLKLIQIPL